LHRGEPVGQTDWALLGRHNLDNALAAISAAVHAGVSAEVALEALSHFKGVKRRLDKRAVIDGITLYEDFAHHPTAIVKTLEAIRSQKPDQRIVAVVEPRSNTMRLGVHRDALRKAFGDADRVFVLAPKNLSWNPESVLAPLGAKLAVAWEAEELLGLLIGELESGDQVIFMSNGDFKGLPRQLQQALKSERPHAARA
jgi:UDP-N-acetylmuramate: L-alanyl-gamma-D-glutamyl-meso-diaminopimelate ligase